MSDVVRLDRDGLACPAGGFHIDPWRAVPCAVLTHAHSDHARPGSAVYHAALPGLDLLRRRLGAGAVLVGHAYGETFRLGAATVSLHPAGHVLGSAQLRIEVGGEVWVVTGDYKREDDPTCAPFVPVPCDVLITEATFALPIYRWGPVEEVVDQVLAFWDRGVASRRASVVYAYSLGKAQRLLALLGRRVERPVHVHPAIAPLVEAYRAAGIALPETPSVEDRPGRADLAGELVIAPPGAGAGAWLAGLADPQAAFASGWMRVRGQRRWRGLDQGFVLSDHADWPGLLATVRESGAGRILATHGHAETLARHLREQGQDARPLATPYAGEAEDG